jgi:hypothetical protein
MKLLGAKAHTKKELKARKHFRNSSREATEIQLLTNLAFKIAEFLHRIADLVFHSTKLLLLLNERKNTTIRLSEKSISLPITMPLNTHFWILLSFTSLPSYKALIVQSHIFLSPSRASRATKCKNRLQLFFYLHETSIML